jgi:hypothetical protein
VGVASCAPAAAPKAVAVLSKDAENARRDRFERFIYPPFAGDEHRLVLWRDISVTN